MSVYEFFKTIHILAAAAWVGGVILTHVQGALVAKSGDQQRILNFTREQGWLGQRYFAPAAITVLIAGIVMVVDSGIAFGDLWIIIGLVLWATSVFVGAGLLGPRGKVLEAAIVERGVDDPKTQELWRNQILLSQIDLVILVLVVINMVIKPGA